MRPTKILGIAPYEGMRSLMMQLASSMTDVELTALVGDLEPGAALVEQYPPDTFDVIISRGGTATYLDDYSVDERGVTWYKISYNGGTGWVSSRYCELH